MHNSDSPAVTESMLCFGLYSAARATTRAYRSFLEPWNLTYPQYLVMLLLWTGGPQRVASLGSAMQLDSGTLSPLLRRLEQQGYVTRTKAENDERVTLISPTEAGSKLRSELATMPGTFREIAGTCDDDELVSLIATLKNLTHSLEQAAHHTTTIAP